MYYFESPGVVTDTIDISVVYTRGKLEKLVGTMCSNEKD